MTIYVLSDGGAQPLQTDEGLGVILDLLVLDLNHEDGEGQEPTQLRIVLAAEDAVTLAGLLVGAATEESN